MRLLQLLFLQVERGGGEGCRCNSSLLGGGGEGPTSPLLGKISLLLEDPTCSSKVLLYSSSHLNVLKFEPTQV